MAGRKRSTRRSSWGEGKTAAWKRLQAEGRWEAFSARKREIKKERKCDNDEAYFLALEEFPPEGVEGKPVEVREREDEEKRAVELRGEVRWALDHFREYVAADEEGQGEILKGAPSGGAGAILVFAAADPKKFMGELVPRVLGKPELKEDEADRKRQVNLERVLESLSEEMKCPECSCDLREARW